METTTNLDGQGREKTTDKLMIVGDAHLRSGRFEELEADECKILGRDFDQICTKPVKNR